MKIGILGTRGVPNYHGGFEQFAEYFSVYLSQEKHDVYVYNSSSHPYQKNTFNGVNIIHCYDPEDKIGTPGQFIYDLNCILDSRKRNFDILLQLGYTSSTIWYRLLPKNAIIITNMDGLEWKRSKYSKPVQKFLKYAEKLGVISSNYLISDSIGIQKHLKQTYNVDSKYIAYGAELFKTPNPEILKEYQVEAYNYNMLIARLEPENNIETILDGVVSSNKKTPFLVVGKHDVNAFGAYLKNKFQNHSHIQFIGGIYNLEHLNNLRYHSNLYFHGHSVGGTNPSLLEAMSSKALIIANDNEFNKTILNNNAFYFKTPEDVKVYVETLDKADHSSKLAGCYDQINEQFNWNIINKEYLDYFKACKGEF
ncbi:MAG TPA: glycosyltransferase family 1 protein [Xanthomarina gelatinilytica]|uniref:Glycosyltransferase family 1 protein n=1 Tax=Xanthomarina gelatinilytica TaxID=1137281 RepID=A0A3D6BMB1_9FLAO|nr:glycosyltransferase family 1 protein [Xanthomarina gelatinilytica]